MSKVSLKRTSDGRKMGFGKMSEKTTTFNGINGILLNLNGRPMKPLKPNQSITGILKSFDQASELTSPLTNERTIGFPPNIKSLYTTYIENHRENALHEPFLQDTIRKTRINKKGKLK